jgi:hypothetical protein
MSKILKKVFRFFAAFSITLSLFATSIVVSSQAPQTTQSNNNNNSQSSLVPGSALCGKGNCNGISNVNDLSGREGIVKALVGIAQFLTFIAAGVAVLFMVFGGYKYMSSNGDSERAESGKSTLVNASIGLAIAILAYTIVFILSQVLSGNLLGGIIGS